MLGSHGLCTRACTQWFFTARCTLVQRAVLRLHVVCLSVCPSLRPSVMLVNHIGWNSSKIISPLVSMGRSLFATLTWRVCSEGNTPKLGPKVTTAMLEKFQVAISPQPVVRSTSCFVLGWGFRGRRILWRYFRFEQIQDSGRRHLG